MLSETECLKRPVQLLIKSCHLYLALAEDKGAESCIRSGFAVLAARGQLWHGTWRCSAFASLGNRRPRSPSNPSLPEGSSSFIRSRKHKRPPKGGRLCLAEDKGLEPSGPFSLTRFPGELLSHSVNPPCHACERELARLVYNKQLQKARSCREKSRRRQIALKFRL